MDTIEKIEVKTEECTTKNFILLLCIVLVIFGIIALILEFFKRNLSDEDEASEEVWKASPTTRFLF